MAEAAQRVFFALWPEAAALERLDAQAARAVARCGGRRMRAATLHMTLLFAGEVAASQLAMLQERAGQMRVPPFDVVIDHLGWWPHNRIVWAGCHDVPSGLSRLSGTLSQAAAAAGITADARPFVPHVTLARNACCVNPLPPEEAISWRVREFTLVASRPQSGDAQYQVLVRWPLSDH